MDRWLIPRTVKNDESVTSEPKVSRGASKSEESVASDCSEKYEVLETDEDVDADSPDQDDCYIEDEDEDEDADNVETDVSFLARQIHDHILTDKSTNLDVAHSFPSPESVEHCLTGLQFFVSPKLIAFMRSPTPPSRSDWLSLKQYDEIDPRKSWIVYILVMTKPGEPLPLIYTGSSTNRNGGYARLQTYYRNKPNDSRIPHHVAKAVRNGYTFKKIIAVAGTPVKLTSNEDTMFRVCMVLR